jgi:signal transduction histidine kinase
MECIGQLASGVAHNFNNVLAVIRANAELILMRSGSLESEYCKCLRQITSASDRAANLTRQMLTLSRKQTVQLRPLDLQILVRELAKMLQGVVGANIEVLYTNAIEGAFVMADRSMLEQTVLNLAINARDAMPDGGQLRIGVEKVCPPQPGTTAHLKLRTGQFYGLKVSDTGTGINSEDLPHIFEPFFTTKEPGKGTGLGLSTVYGIVKQHEGWVEVASRVGEGTTFDIILPAIPAPAPLMEPARDTRTIGVELPCALNPSPPNPAINSLTLPQLSSNR